MKLCHRSFRFFWKLHWTRDHHLFHNIRLNPEIRFASVTKNYWWVLPSIQALDFDTYQRCRLIYSSKWMRVAQGGSGLKCLFILVSSLDLVSTGAGRLVGSLARISSLDWDNLSSCQLESARGPYTTWRRRCFIFLKMDLGLVQHELSLPIGKAYL